MGNRIDTAIDGVVQTGRHDLAPDESALLSGLINGERVAAAARDAGLSLRTAHRRLTLLRARWGVTTNAQLLQRGTEAARCAHATSRVTERQRQVLELVGEGCTSDEIGVRLGITSATVESHI